MILPLAAMFFVAIHFWRIRKDGGLYAHRERAGDRCSQEAAAPAKEATR